MASSNRHWPSMFKSKPCSNHHQCLHDINSVNPSCLVSSAPCQKLPYTPAPACEERSPEPKPRWNPKPEQIRILEAIFNSGMVNPPRDEIRKIRAQLQEYGQVGDANVFYWFQNRKSRSKHKLRTAAATARSQPRTSASLTASVPAITANSSSSSSSERSTGSEKNPPPVMVSMSGSPTTSVNQTYFPCPVDFCGDSFILQGPQYYIPASELTGAFGPGEPAAGVSPGMWSELMLHNVSSVATTSVSPLDATTVATTTNVATSGNEMQGLGTPAAATPARSTVFINEVVYDVLPNPLNVRELFGDQAVLFHSNGNRVPVDEWGTTLQPLQHGASYYLVFSPFLSFSSTNQLLPMC